MDKVIALDIGNVCFRINIEQCLNDLEIKNFKKASELYVMHETGKINSTIFLHEIKEMISNTNLSNKEIIRKFLSIIKDEILGMNEIVTSLTKKAYRICFLSDTSELHLTEIISRLSFAHLVTGGTYSFEVGALKPDPKMFLTFEKVYGKPTLYIDDKLENCLEAQKIGWTVHYFKDVVSLRNVVDSLF